MSELNISQAEADFLFKMEKISEDDKEWELPISGGNIIVPLVSKDKKENFSLDIYQGRIDLSRRKYQTRTRQVIILARLDFSSPHRNPDGNDIGVPHLHLYKEGYNHKWAYPVPNDIFVDINDNWQTLFDFMKFCNISESPNFKKGLFS
ncbi:MAG: hypothetical protein WCG23_06685 [bacterium]